MVGVTALTLLLSAGPAVAKTPAHTSISAHLAATTVLVRSTATVTGTVTPAAGSVALQRLVGGQWTTVAHAKPTKTGAYTFAVRAPKSASTWSLKVVRAASTTAKAGTSSTLTLHAVTQQFLVLATSAGATTAPAASVVSGLAAPSTKGSVQLQQLVGKTWIALATGRIGTGGAFSISNALPAGAHTLRVIRPYTSSVAQGTSTAFTVTVSAAAVLAAPTITTAALPAARVGVPYAALLTATGGGGFYAWSATGLPAGLTVSAAGLLAGTPSGQGTSALTATVTDGAGHSANGSLSLTVAAPAGRLLSVGYNSDGELGNGTTVAAATVVPVAGMTSVIAAATGTNASLAVKADGTVWAWGRSPSGELGMGNTVSSLVPEQVPGLSGFVAVAAGTESSFALKGDGTVWAWGNNVSGEIGNGNQNNQLSPVQVIGLGSVVAISSTNDTAYALRSDGTVWAWGYNLDGALGNGSTAIFSALPVQVSGLTGIKGIASSLFNGYAIRSDGTVAAWGDDDFDQLGDGMPAAKSSVPVSVSGVSQATQLSGGLYAAYALTSSGTVFGWGNNSNAELGGASSNNPSGPVAIRTGALAAGGADGGGFALLTDHTVLGWGQNSYGEVGNATNSPVGTPTAMTGVSGVQTLVTGGFSETVLLITS